MANIIKKYIPQQRIPEGVDIITLSGGKIYISDNCGIAYFIDPSELKNSFAIEKLTYVTDGILIESQNDKLYYISLSDNDITLNEIEAYEMSETNITSEINLVNSEKFIDSVTGLTIILARENQYIGYLRDSIIKVNKFNLLDYVNYDINNDESLIVYFPALGGDINDINNILFEYEDTLFAMNTEVYMQDSIIFWQPPYIFTKNSIFNMNNFKSSKFLISSSNSSSNHYIPSIKSYNVLGDSIIVNSYNEETNISTRYLVEFGDEVTFHEIVIVGGEIISSNFDSIIIDHRNTLFYMNEDHDVPLNISYDQIIISDIRRQNMINKEINETEIAINPNIKNIIAEYTY